MSQPDAELELTLLMPCLDEHETIATCVTKARQALAELCLEGEVLVADNGSTDGSRALAEQAGARVVPVPVKGYGAALQGGIAAAHGRYVIMGDADDSYDWSAIGPFVEKLRGGAELVMGCRLPKGGGTILPGAMPFSHRWLGNPGLSAVGRLFFGCPVTDFHCGLRGFSREAIESLDLRTMGMEFASEMVIRATLAKLRIEQVPITLHPDGRSGRPKLRTWRDGWRHLRFMLLYSPRWLFLLPGLLLMLLGLVGFGAVLPGPFHLGRLALDLNSLLVFALCLLVGFQIVSFAVSARIFATSEGLLPPDPSLQRAYRIFTLERGLLVSMLVGLGGLGLLLGTVAEWVRAGFGELSYQWDLRRTIPGVTLLALGAQGTFTSFFLSLVGLERRRGELAPEDPPTD